MGAEGVAAGSGDRPFGVLFNPKDYPWTEDACNVHWRELKRIEDLRVAWYGKAFVGDGADGVRRDELDPWQKFAHDIVMDPRHSLTSPLRLMMLGSAGTGKSRTVRAFVGSRRERVRVDWDGQLQRATWEASAKASAKARAERAGGRVSGRSVAEALGVPAEDLAAYLAVERATTERRERRAAAQLPEDEGVARVRAMLAERIRNSCLLAAPTGCASFQLRFGASTLHRVFGVPVGYVGPWKSYSDGRFLKMKARMVQARLFVMDEMSMIGRSMLGKIEYKVQEILRGVQRGSPEEIYLGGGTRCLRGTRSRRTRSGTIRCTGKGTIRGRGRTSRGAARALRRMRGRHTSCTAWEWPCETVSRML